MERLAWLLAASYRHSVTHDREERLEGSPHELTMFSFLKQQKGPRSDNSKSNKIFVGGIPHNCGETELREYFKKFGVVSASRTGSPAAQGGSGQAMCPREVKPGRCPLFP